MAGIWETLLRAVVTNGLGGPKSVAHHRPAAQVDQRAASRSPLAIGPSLSRPVVVNPSLPPGRVVVTHSPRTLVRKVQRPIWEEKGWESSQRHDGTVYQGFFEVVVRDSGQQRRFAGVVLEGSRGIAAYIADPPLEIRQHPKGPCFAMTQSPWFIVHWHEPPPDVDNAILYVETVLDESLNGW